MSEALTPPEKYCMDLTTRLMNLFVSEVVLDGPSRDQDIAEFAVHIHSIQKTFMAQAAARAYPTEYRLLGGELV